MEFLDPPVSDRREILFCQIPHLTLLATLVVAPYLHPSLPAPRDTSEHLFLLTRHPGHLFLSRPKQKVYVMAFICADQTCLLANAAKRDKRRSPGILGTVPELNVLGTEAVDSHIV